MPKIYNFGAGPAKLPEDVSWCLLVLYQWNECAVFDAILDSGCLAIF